MSEVIDEVIEVESKPRLGRPPKTEAAEATVDAAKPVKMYKVTIHSGEDKGDKGDVFLSHNHRSVLIQRDKEVTVSEYFLECLKHSMIETVVTGDDGAERAVKIPRFSYSSAPA